MTPELALKLRDAGFPVKKLPESWVQMDGPSVLDFAIPSFSDILHELGSSFRSLVHLDDFSGYKAYGLYNGKWVGTAEYQNWEEDGETPEEAVAKLWLTIKSSIND